MARGLVARQNEGVDAYLELVERKILPPFLLAVVLLSVVDRVWGLLPDGWSVPLQFFVLFLLLRWLGDVKVKVRSLASEPPVRHYADYVTYYEELGRAVRDARHSVLATYEQVAPPLADAPEAGSYFDSALAWVSRKPGERTFQRLIRVPRGDPMMSTWANEQAASAARVRGYYVRFEECGPEKKDGCSIVIVDQQTVFVAFFLGSGQEIKSHSIHSESVARDYEVYFRERWNNASPVPRATAARGAAARDAGQ
jgi:hypothetical protein